MKICQVGNLFSTADIIDFYSTITFIDYDLVIIDIDTIISKSHQYSQAFFKKRENDFIEFVEYKKIPIVFISPSTEQMHMGQNTYSFDELFYSLDFVNVNGSGKIFDIKKGKFFNTFFENFQNHFYYNSFFSSFNGKSILETPTGKCISYFNNNCLLLPKVSRSINLNESDFFSSLYEALIQVNREIDKTELPEWASKYFLPKEKSKVKAILETKNKIIELQQLLKSKEEEVENFKRKKSLLVATGDSLESEIEKIFRELGFEILESDRDRDDLIVKYNDKIGVVEIKGVTGSAAEKNATQLEKWRTLYYDKHEIHPKGILIINSFREKDLVERTEDTFPHQMLKYSNAREHCLISSLQLLGLYYDAIQNNKKDELIDTLFSTIGVYNGYEDWQSFIEV